MALTTTNKFSAKSSTETVLVSFDFSNVLDLDKQEHLIDAIWSSTLIGGTSTQVALFAQPSPVQLSTMGLGLSGEPVSSTAVSGADASNELLLSQINTAPTTIITGVLNITDTNTSYFVQGGNDGETYELSVVATTSFGQILKIRGQIAIVDAQ